MIEKVTLTISGLKADIENGLTRPEIATKYNLPVGQINKAMKQAGLDSMKARRIKFELIDDTIAHTIVADDLDNNPELVGQVEVGERITLNEIV